MAKDDGLFEFSSVRSRLFGIAYRVLKNASDAEDIVQDVWVRWQAADRTVIRDAAAFLVTTTDAPRRASSSPSPVSEFTPVSGDAAKAS